MRMLRGQSSPKGQKSFPNMPNSLRKSFLKSPWGFALAVFSMSNLVACSESSGPEPPVEKWSDEQEVIHQTRQVIRYEEERYRLEVERLGRLGVEPGSENSDQEGERQRD